MYNQEQVVFPTLVWTNLLYNFVLQNYIKKKQKFRDTFYN